MKGRLQTEPIKDQQERNQFDNMSSAIAASPTQSDTNAEGAQPYKCSIEIKFPSALHAKNAKEVLEVDREIGDRVTKSLRVEKHILTV